MELRLRVLDRLEEYRRLPATRIVEAQVSELQWVLTWIDHELATQAHDLPFTADIVRDVAPHACLPEKTHAWHPDHGLDSRGHLVPQVGVQTCRWCRVMVRTRRGDLVRAGLERASLARLDGA